MAKNIKHLSSLPSEVVELLKRAQEVAPNAYNKCSNFYVGATVVDGAEIGGGGARVTPCGRCRQIIFEAATVSNCEIMVYSSNMDLSEVLITNISELLPFPFLRE